MNKITINNGIYPALSGLSLLLAFFLAFFLAFLPGISAAATEKAPQAEKIYINADHMQMNTDTGNSTYNGHVTIRQGKRVLTGNTVIIIQQNNQVKRMHVTGNPATYTQVTDKNETIHATSQQMNYTTDNHLLVLTGNATLTQPAHTIKSQKIVYDTVSKVVVAGNHKLGNTAPLAPRDRVTIILTPKTAPLPQPSGGESSNRK